MAGKFWREAATLLLIGKSNHKANALKQYQQIKSSKTGNQDQKKTKTNMDGENDLSKINYNMLCLKRSAKSSFMPNTYVFPGGALDEADKSKDWFSILESFGQNESSILERYQFTEGRPFIYSNKSSSEILPELSFRICALRETFEETGVLLISSESENGGCLLLEIEDSERLKWQALVQKDAKNFLDLYHHVKKLPAFFELLEWDGWLTPAMFKSYKRRFETAFFITFLNDEIPIFQHCSEAEELKKDNPFNFLKSYYDGKITLEPPQIYEFGRLLNFGDYQNLKKYSEERAKLNLPRWLPVFVGAKDGIISTLPGDDLYPSNPDYYGDEEMQTVEETMEQNNMRYKNLNRLHFRQGKTTLLYCNTTNKSHLSPKIP